MSRENILLIASSEIGVFEDPPGSNQTKYNEWFELPKSQWCSIFVSWVYAHAGHSLGHGDFAKGFASVPFLLKHFHDKITTDPHPGDLVIYDWQKGKVKETEWSADHTGIFKGWLDKGAGLFEAIEGNTSTANQSNGGMVMLRQRNLAFVEAFVDPLNLPI